MRRLLHTGITMWLRGFSSQVMRPCCEVGLVGGDGTFIGIPTQNIPRAAQPVWQPQQLRAPSYSWDRRARQPLSKGFVDARMTSTASDEFLDSLRDILSLRNNEAQRRLFAIMLNETKSLQRVSSELSYEFCRWLQMPTFSKEFKPLRMIFSCLFAQESITGVFPPQLATTILRNKNYLLGTDECLETVARLSSEYAFRGCGIGPEIIEVFNAQLLANSTIKSSTVNMLCYFAKLSSELHQCMGPPPPPPSQQSTDEWFARPNPATTGIRYFVTEHGRSLQHSWPLPSTSISRLNHVETSCAGCTKKRPMYIGHRQRTGIWINLCMVHELVVGYHLIHNQEGRRDAIIPIFRFWEAAPLAVWNDFGCGCEESGLNWIPEFFHGVQHFHDMFHGFAHTSCSKKFFSRRLQSFSSLNTSLMEQVNSFLQPLRILVKSATTKVILCLLCYCSYS
jgi:hypothetical protein